MPFSKYIFLLQYDLIEIVFFNEYYIFSQRTIGIFIDTGKRYNKC